MKLFKKESKIEKEEYFSFCVEGIYEHKNDELFVLGIVDGIMQKLDSLFLIGPYGYEEKVEIQEWIEVDSKQNYYALLIDQCFQEEIDQGYIFTNKNNHLASSREEVYNPYLQFLLDQVNCQHYDYLDILFEQLATRAYFLAVFDYQDFPIYQINDKKYYPIYTSQLEMNKDQKCKNKKGSVYSFDDYSFSKLKAAYYKKTKKSMEMKDFESFGIVDKNGMLTNAGALLADESPILCSRLFCTRWNGIDKASGVIDALDDEEYTGSLILLLEEGMNFARRNSKKMWKKESDRRVEYPEYPERSIFEGLVNGLVHRDYLDMGSEVHIDIFDDHLEIYSPGGMYDGTLIQDRDIDNVPSKRRNPVVADIFSRLDYMERRGSGFKKIMQAYEVEPNYTEDKKPVFYSNATEFRVILKNLNFTDEVLNEKNEVLDEVLNEVLDSGRTEMEIKVIKAILFSPRIKQKELAEQVGTSVSTIQRTIKKLVKEGKIVRVNGKRDGYWKVL